MILFPWMKTIFGMNPMDFIPVSGRITSYGYAEDSTPDWNSAHAIGAWNNRLDPYKSLAVSPDIESVFRSVGISPKQAVEIQCANGDVLSLVWADRTANDAQAKQIGLKPLRGRFDIYSPSGKCAHNDRAVTGFRRV